MSGSITRTIRNFFRLGPREYVRQLIYIGDPKVGRLVGTDQFGNRYFENLDPYEETPGRHRWVDFAQHQYHASQVPPEWHSWIHHIRTEPPTQDPVVQSSTPSWKAPWVENLTGTRGAYKPYNTAGPKIHEWQPKITPRA